MQLQKTIKVTNKVEWMPCPNIHVEYPGLAYVYPLDELIIAEVRDALHDVIGTSKKISYTIFNNLGQKIFLAVRDNRWRRYTIKIYNIYGNEVIEIKRLFTLCLNSIQVWAPPGHFVGSVKEKFCNKYHVRNYNGARTLNIRSESRFALGIFNIRYICGVLPIGVIRKYNCPVEALDVKAFGVSFPVQLDVKDKAVLLGACFMIGSSKY